MIKYGQPQKVHQWAFLEGLVKGTAVLAAIGQVLSALSESIAVWNPDGLFGRWGGYITVIAIVFLIEGGTRYFFPIHAQSFFNILRGFRKNATDEDKDLRKSGAIIFMMVSIPLILIVFFSYELSQEGKNKFLEQSVIVPTNVQIDSSEYRLIASTANNQFAADSLGIVSTISEEKAEMIAKLKRTKSKGLTEVNRLKTSNDYDANSTWFKSNIKESASIASAAQSSLSDVDKVYNEKLTNALNKKRSELSQGQAVASSTLLGETQNVSIQNDSIQTAFMVGLSNQKRTYDWIIFLGIGFVALHSYLKHLAYYLSDKAAIYVENPFDKSIGIFQKFKDVSRAKLYIKFDSWIDSWFNLDENGLDVIQKEAAINFIKHTPTHTKASVVLPASATHTSVKAVIPVVPQQTQLNKAAVTKLSVFDYSNTRSNLKTYIKRLFNAHTSTVEAGVERYAAKLAAAGFKVEYIDDVLTVDDKNSPSMPLNSTIEFEFDGTELIIKSLSA